MCQMNALWSISPTLILLSSSDLCNSISTEDTQFTSYVCNVLTPYDNMTEKINFLQAAMGYRTKFVLLLAIKKGNLSSVSDSITVQ